MSSTARFKFIYNDTKTNELTTENFGGCWRCLVHSRSLMIGLTLSLFLSSIDYSHPRISVDGFITELISKMGSVNEYLCLRPAQKICHV